MNNYLADVAIIIVTWNSCHVLGDCLNSIYAAAKRATVDIWVIDNASSDGTVDYLHSAQPDVSVIANHANVGFARANNQAAFQSHSRYLLLLNPDTRLLPEALDQMVAYADSHTAIGVVGPQLLNPDLTIQRSCWRGYPGIGMAAIDGAYLWKVPWLSVAQRSEYRPHELLQPREVDHLLGACLLIRREAWEQVGPLDESFFLFLEETDWCWRARQQGWKIVYYPDAEVLHFGQHSMRQQPVRNLPHLYRSYCHFYRKYHPGALGGIMTLKAIIASAALVRIGLWTTRAAYSTKAISRKQAWQMVNGYRQVLRDLPYF